MLVLAVVLATTSCGSVAPRGAREPEVSPKKQVTMDPTPVAGITVLECGKPFRPPPTGGPLTLAGRFPAAAQAGEREVTGTVEATGRVAVRGVVAPHAEVFLVRHGRVATVPVPQDLAGVRWDLARGKTERLPGEATLVSCDPAGGPVPPGTYELYARVVFTPDDGAGVESFGGPWSLEVR